MDPSQYNRKVLFQRETPGAANALNEPASVWVDICWAWARKLDLSDAEKTTAGARLSVRSARFRVRSTAKTRALSANDQLVLGTDTWNIKGVKEADEGLHRVIEVSAVMASDG